jgi:hypothetical protein
VTISPLDSGTADYTNEKAYEAATREENRDSAEYAAPSHYSSRYT